MPLHASSASDEAPRTLQEDTMNRRRGIQVVAAQSTATTWIPRRRFIVSSCNVRGASSLAADACNGIHGFRWRRKAGRFHIARSRASMAFVFLRKRSASAACSRRRDLPISGNGARAMNRYPKHTPKEEEEDMRVTGLRRVMSFVVAFGLLAPH